LPAAAVWLLAYLSAAIWSGIECCSADVPSALARLGAAAFSAIVSGSTVAKAGGWGLEAGGWQAAASNR